MLKWIKKQNRYLLIIIGLALGLRLYGISHGFPFIYNIDEPAVIRSSYGIRFEINPKHFDWPHFHFYLNFLLYAALYVVRGVFQISGLRGLVESVVPILWRDPLVFYLSSRVLDAILGALTVVPVFLTGKRLFSERLGLVSAFALSIFPYHVWASHFALIDVPMVFWFSISLYFSSRILDERTLKNYLLAGAFAGLATSTKYNGIFGFVMILFAHLLSLGKPNLGLITSKHHRLLFAAATAFLITFFVGTPFALLDFDTFSRSDSPKGAFWQFSNVGKVGFDEFVVQLEEVLTARFLKDFGYTYLFVLEAYTFIFLLSPKTKQKAFVTVSTVLYLIYVTTFDKNRIHYYMPAFPLVSLIIALFYEFAVGLAGKVSLFKTGKFISTVILLAVFLVPLLTSIKNSYLLSIPDTRNLLYSWVNSNVQKGANGYYLGNDLDAVMEKTGFKKVSSMYSLMAKGISPDYIAIASSGLSDRSGVGGLAKEYEEVYKVVGKERLGPDIYVYKLKNSQN